MKIVINDNITMPASYVVVIVVLSITVLPALLGGLTYTIKSQLDATSIIESPWIDYEENLANTYTRLDEIYARIDKIYAKTTESKKLAWRIGKTADFFNKLPTTDPIAADSENAKIVQYWKSGQPNLVLSKINSTQSDVEKLRKDIKDLKDSLSIDTEKALSIPLLRKEIDNLKDHYLLFRENISNSLDWFKYILGIYLSVTLVFFGFIYREIHNTKAMIKKRPNKKRTK